MTGVAALTLCAGFTSCSHDDFEPMTQAQIDKAKYDMAFLNYVGGKIAANQDWGFGATRALTRAVFSETWSGVHADCKLDDSVFDMAVPAGAVDLTKGSFTDAEKSATAFYIPAEVNGELNFNYAFNIPAGAKIYNLGKVTSINGVNYNGVVTFYNVEELGFGEYNGGRHTVINTGVLTVFSYGNIGKVYNKGTLVLERGHSPYWPNEGGTADISNETYIYSDGEGSVMMPDGGDLKAVCDIHGTLTVGDRDNNVVKNVKIQNSTRKYICGIDATGTVENVDGPLETSYIKADVFKFDGNPIYLLPGGHVDVTTLQVPNSNCHFYGAANSTGLVEAVNYEFGNKNDFTHTFSNNIYFKVNGGYVKVDNCYAMGQSHYFDTVEKYLADTTHSDEFALAADRINAGDATGTPACGQPWTVGTPTTTPEPETPTTPTPEPTEEYDLRIIAEDLSATGDTDFDFNDVVFDVKFDATNAKIKILAAGGTLPLRIDGKYEVHEALGAGENEMVNTNANGGVKKDPAEIELGYGVADPSDAKKIKVEVFKNNAWQTLEAEQGEPAAKMAVSTDFQWLDERASIKDAYPGFIDWVQGQSRENRWW